MAQLYIGGEWTAAAAGTTRQVLNPFDASRIAEVDEAGHEDVERAVLAARRAFDTGEWSGGSVRRRADVLHRVCELLLRDMEEIARTETADTGKTLAEARIDVQDVADAFRYFAEIADKDGGRVVDLGPDVLSRVEYRAAGVCVLIAPWNYPLLQASWKVAPALAAGDTFVLKPSETTPLSTIKMVQLIEEAGAPPGVANLVLGDGSVGEALVRHPQVDLVSFTGGLATGRRIMAAAAPDVKKVALELGGKNPNVVFEDADFEAAVDYALDAAFLHSGQVCSAGSRLMVQDGLHDRFLDDIGRPRGADPARGRDGGGHRERPAQLGRAPREGRGVHRVGRAEGARLATGGRASRGPRAQPAASSCSPPSSPTATGPCASCRRRCSGRW